MSIFEMIMLICFGVGWPVSIIKSLRTKQVVGKSPLFMVVVLFGYISGIIHKVFYSMDAVIVLYILNLIFVSFDLYLYYKYLPQKQNNIQRTENK